MVGDPKFLKLGYIKYTYDSIGPQLSDPPDQTRSTFRPYYITRINQTLQKTEDKRKICRKISRKIRTHMHMGPW